MVSSVMIARSIFNYDGVFSGALGRRVLSLTRDPNLDVEATLASCTRKLEEGEYLYMGLRGGSIPPALMPRVEDADVFACYYQQFLNGMYTRCEIYAVPGELVDRCAQLIASCGGQS